MNWHDVGLMACSNTSELLELYRINAKDKGWGPNGLCSSMAAKISAYLPTDAFPWVTIWEAVHVGHRAGKFTETQYQSLVEAVRSSEYEEEERRSEAQYCHDVD